MMPNIFQISEKKIGKAKGQSINIYGHSKSYDSKLEARKYFATAYNYIDSSCTRIKDNENNPLTLTAYFDTKYNKKGEETGFEFKSAEFVQEPDKNPKKVAPDTMTPKEKYYRQMTIFDYMN